MNKKHFYPIVILLLFLAAGSHPALAIIYLSDSGWDPPTVGTWDPLTLTGMLTTDVSETIQITSDGIILDGANHTIAGSGPAPGDGVFLQEKTGVTIKGLNVQNFEIGIHLVRSDNCIVTGNNVLNNGIGISISTYSDYNTVTENNVSGNEDGINIYMYSHNNNLGNNTVSDNTQYGIEIEISKDYTLTSNTVSNNYIGIRVNGCSATDPSVNTMTDNTVSNNVGGIYLNDSSKNQIYNNNLIVGETTLWLAHMYENCSGNVFDLGDPVAGGKGGNYWSDYTGQDRGDGIGDIAYTFTDGQDNYPWVNENGWVSNQPPVANAGSDQTVECACQTPVGTQVTLDGSGSTDPDGDPLTYEWTGPFVEGEGTVSGATPTVTLDPGCVGDYVISLVVNDGQVDSGEDTVTITVVDTTPPDITCPGYLKIELQGPDGVPVDDERIQTFLGGASATDNCDPDPYIFNDAPAVFPPGDTIVTFIAEDASGNSSSCSATVTVVEAAEANLRIIPQTINREGRLKRILAVIRFPEGVTEDDIDIDQPLMLFPGDSLDDIQAIDQRIVAWSRGGNIRVSIFATFDKDEVTAAVPEDGEVEMMVIGRFVSGQYFYGFDTVRIISWSWRR